MVHGTLFCSDCDDVVYDPRFMQLQKIEHGRSTVRCASETALESMLENDAIGTDGKRLEPICRGGCRVQQRLLTYSAAWLAQYGVNVFFECDSAVIPAQSTAAALMLDNTDDANYEF